MEHVEWLILIMIDWIQVIAVINAISDCRINITKKKILCYMIFSALFIALVVIFDQEVLGMNTGIILCLFFTYLCVDKQKNTLWIGVILIYLVVSCVDLLVYAVVSRIEVLQTSDLQILGSSLGGVIVVGLAQLYAKNMQRKLDENANKAVKMLAGCMLMIGSLVAAFPIVNGDLLGKKYVVLFSVYVLILTMGSILLVYYSIENESYKLQELIGQEKQQLLNQYYNQVLDNNLHIRQFRHDYKNHIRCMRYYVKERKYEQLADYIEALDECNDDHYKCIDVGHEFVNAILSDCVKKSKEQGITIEISGIIMGRCEVADIDWSIILYNCINNAIETVEKLKDQEKKIKITFSQMKNKLILMIENSIIKLPVIKDGEIKTTKADNISHGLGIKNVKQSIRKYRGDLSYKINKEEMIIVTEVILRVSEMSPKDV